MIGLKNNQAFKKFFDFFSKGNLNENLFFLNFSKFQKIFFEYGLNGTYEMFKETKSWNMSSFEVST